MHTVAIDPTFASFRGAARDAVARGWAPASVRFVDRASSEQTSLLFTEPSPPPAAPPFTVPRGYVALAERVALHRDPSVWDALYRVLFRIVRGEPSLLDVATDPDVRALALLDAAVARDVHKMHAFVRFREARATDGDRVWFSFYEPDHRVVARAAPFFVDRFGGERFVIATPDATFVWDREDAFLGPGAPTEAAARAGLSEDRAREDGIVDAFRGYYESIFNPARLATRAMRAEMPERFWKHLPEARSIAALVRDASAREDHMLDGDRSEPRPSVPATTSLPELASAAARCAVCPHAAHATGTVFGAGPRDARIVLVGEQPGDEEDRAGEPFVGPAGRLLRELLAEAGLSTEDVYLTNAVKHFTWESRGKRRLHVRPHQRAVRACRPWLEAELRAIAPKVVVCLGSTAGQSFLGPGFRVTQALGKWLPQPWVEAFLVTYHPSAILRMVGHEEKAAARARLVEDLRRAREAGGG